MKPGQKVIVTQPLKVLTVGPQVRLDNGLTVDADELTRVVGEDVELWGVTLSNSDTLAKVFLIEKNAVDYQQLLGGCRIIPLIAYVKDSQ